MGVPLISPERSMRVKGGHLDRSLPVKLEAYDDIRTQMSRWAVRGNGWVWSGSGRLKWRTTERN